MPLTPREEDAFECLQEVVGGMDGGCRRAAAIEAVVAFEFDRDEAVYVVDQLLLKGYLYAIGDEIRVTY